MRRSEAFIAGSVLFSAVVFGVYRTPFTIYMGLLYALIMYIGKENVRFRKPKLDPQTILGTVFVAISPVFLIVTIEGYTSPSSFHALALTGASLVLLEIRGNEGPLGILGLELFTALVSKTEGFKGLVANLSELFVDVTSHAVRGLIDVFNVPIVMRGNVAVVRNSMVIIGSGCSGLDAFILYILASLLMVYIRRSDRKEAFLLLAGALGIIPLNALRIFTLLVIGYHSGISFLELFHSHLGDLMFVVYVFGYWWLVLKSPKKHQDTSWENGK